MASIGKNTLFYVCSSGLAAAVSFISLPLTTLVLDPAHFGEFALLGAIIAAVHGAFSSVTGYFINCHYSRTHSAQRPVVIASVLVATVFVSLPGVALSFALLQTVPALISGFSLSTHLYAVFSATLIPLALWASVSQMMVLDERAFPFALGNVINPLVAAVGTVILVHTTSLRTEALVWGAIAGNILVGLYALPWCLGRTGLASREAVRKILRLAPTAISGNGLEAVHPFVERSVLAGAASLHGLGLYTHSQAYSQTVGRLAKAVALSTFPLSLREATEQPRHFAETGRIWSAAYYGLTIVILGFVFFGERFIALVTHGKFVEAYPFACALVMISGTQYLGRQANALLYSQGRSQAISTINLISAAVALMALAVLVPFFGIYGAVAAIAVRTLVNRATVLALTWPVGLGEDLLLVRGLLISVVAFVANDMLHPSIGDSALLFIGFLVLLSCFARRGAISAFRILFLRAKSIA